MTIPSNPVRQVKMDGALLAIDGSRTIVAYYDEARDFLYKDEFLASDYFGFTEFEPSNSNERVLVEHYLPLPSEVTALPEPHQGYAFKFNLKNGAVFNASYELSAPNMPKCDLLLALKK